MLPTHPSFPLALHERRVGHKSHVDTAHPDVEHEKEEESVVEMPDAVVHPWRRLGSHKKKKKEGKKGKEKKRGSVMLMGMVPRRISYMGSGGPCPGRICKR